MRGRSTRWWLWPALACLALVVAVSGAGGTGAESTAPAYGMVSQTNVGSQTQTLVRIDPRTLKPLAGGLPIPQGLAFGSRSPDGRSAAFFDYQRPSVRIVDLEKLENRGDIAVAPAGWKARATAWLTADRVAVVVQKMRGSYDQIVDRREVVLVDPFARQIVARTALSAGTALTTSASGGDKLVLLLGRGDARTRIARVAVIDSTGAMKTVALDLGAPAGLRVPSLVASPSGERAFVVAAGAPIYQIDLDTMEVTAHTPTGGGAAVLAATSFGARQTLLLGENTLAVSGRNSGHDKGVAIARPAGLSLIDATTWQARLIDPRVSDLSASGDTLIGSSFRIDRVVVKGRVIQKLSGIGLRAYTADGARRWQRDRGQAVFAQAFRGSALVHRSASPPAGWGKSFVIGLARGNTIRVETDPKRNLSLLPDVPDAPPPRSPSGASVTALELDGTGERFHGTAQPEVTRVVASLVDGSERELTLDAGAVSYQAASPNERARTVQAYAGDQLVTSITLAVACGGSMGPCPAVAPLSTTAQNTPTPTTTPLSATDPSTLASTNPASTSAMPTYAFFGDLYAGDAKLARVDPRTLASVGRSLRLTEPYMPSFARSPDGREVALAARDKPLIEIVDLTSLRILRTLRLGSTREEARALAWLADDRLVVVIQRMSQPTRRYVRERTAVTLDATSGRIVAREPLTNNLAIQGVATGGDRLALLLRSSLGKGSTVELAVIEANGAVRTRRIEIGQTGGALNQAALAVEPSGKRAFLLSWALRNKTPPVIEVTLDTLATARHQVHVEHRRPLAPAALSTLRVGSVDDRYLVAFGTVSATEQSDGMIVPAAGIFAIDTQTWTAKQIDERASDFQIHDSRVISYGPSSNPSDRQSRPRGSGVSISEPDSPLRSHLYGRRAFQQIEVAGNYGHILRGDYRYFLPNGKPAKRLVFDARTGKPLGMLPALPQPIEIIPAATPPTTPNRPPASGARAPSSAVAQPDPFATVSNRGTRVESKAATHRERELTPKDVFLLKRAEGRAVYRIGGLKPGYSSCFASGSGNEIGRLGSIGCNRGFPSRTMPVQHMAVMSGTPGGKGLKLIRVEGVAADAVAEIGLTDSGGNVIARVPVEGNVYVLAHPPSGATGDYLAYDSRGTIVLDSRRRAQRPAAPANPRRLAGFRLKITVPKGWSGEIHRSNAGPARAALFAGNRLPARDPSAVSVALVERDPREQPAYPTITTPPQITLADVRAGDVGNARVDRNFTLHGRQFQLQIALDRSRATPTLLREINRMLATLDVGAIAVQKTPSGAPLQHASADNVTVDVYRSGAVVFHFDPASTLYRQLQSKNVSVSCLTFDSTSPWQPNETGSSAKRVAETVQVLFGPATQHVPPYATLDPTTEAEPPFDGCLVSGSYGRRWNDPPGQHSPAEIAFTAKGRRFFAERAVARDLSLFARSPKLAAARRTLKQGGNAPAAVALTRGLPDRVVALTERVGPTAQGEIGVWTNRRDTIEVSARTPAGKRLSIEIRDGRIARHNLEGLAFVF